MLATLRSAQLVLAIASLLPFTLGHLALWDDSMYGWDPKDPNQSEPVLPLMKLPFSQWWFHGYVNKPPAAGKFMNLPSGGTYHGQVACNKALTSYGQNVWQRTGEYACDNSGPLHTTDQLGSSNPTDVTGCGIAIAYESDVTKIKPEDFVVISTNHSCPWKKNVDFQIPSDLPACPEGGCHCMWGWVHAADSGSEQNYFLGYRCNVTGATGTRALPSPKTANKCDYPSDTANCTVGARQPHYWYQAEGNNNPQGEYDPPFYNGKYGFMDGAQTDLFAAVGGSSQASSPPSPAQSSSSVVTAASSQAISQAAAGPPSAASSMPPATTAIGTSTTASTSSSVSLNSSMTGTMAAPATASPTSVTHATCRRRKRALDNLSDPKNLVRHRLRQARRLSRRTEESTDLGKFARAQREWREERERSGLGLRSLGRAV